MSKEALAKVVQRAISDAAFRRQLNSDPAGALRGFDLSADEMAAVRTGDAGRLSTLGIDQRMSKAFTLGASVAATKMAASDLTSGNPSALDDNSGMGSRTVIPAHPREVGSADASGSEAIRAKLPNDPDRAVAADGSGGVSGTSTVRAGDDYKFTDRVSAESAGNVRIGDDWKFDAARSAAAPIDGSPEAAAAENAGSGGMANYPAHDGLAGPSTVSAARAGDDWARSASADSAGRIGNARLDDASGGASGGATAINDDPDGFLNANKNADFSTVRSAINDDPDGFLNANKDADLSGGVTRANVVNDDPDGFLAANKNADLSGAGTSSPNAFLDESEAYLSKVGYDPSVTDNAVRDAHDHTWSGDDSSIPDTGDGTGSVDSDHGPDITP